MDPAGSPVREVRLHLESSESPQQQHEQPRAIPHSSGAHQDRMERASIGNASGKLEHRDEDKVPSASGAASKGATNGHSQKSDDYFRSAADEKNASLVSSWKAPTNISRNAKPDCWRTRLDTRWKQSWLYEFTSTGHEDACAFECSTRSGPEGAIWPPLYPAAAVKARPWLRLHRFYNFYMRPWMYAIISIGVALYFFVVMNSISTWRTNAMADKHGYLPVTPGIDDTVPASAQLPADKIFILSDVFHDWIPQASGAEYLRWDKMVDGSLALMLVLFASITFAQRNLVRLAQWISCLVVLFFIDGVLHVLTTYPDPWGSNGSCQDAGKRVFGSWIFTSLQFEYCGDQMFSGHTFNWIIGCIMIRRAVYEWIGWDSLPLTCLTHSTANYTRANDSVSALHTGTPEAAAALKKQILMAGFGEGFHTRNSRVLTKHSDCTTLHGVDNSGNEELEAAAPKPVGSAKMLVQQLAESEGASRERALELAALMRMPVHALVAGPGEGVGIDVEMPVQQQLNPHVTAGPLAVGASSSNADAIRGGAAQKSLDSAPASSASATAAPFGVVPSVPTGRVVQVYNGPLADLPMNSMSGMRALEDDYSAFAMASDPTVPRALPTQPFQLTAAIPSTHGGKGIGGHYGASEGAVNLGHFPSSAASSLLVKSADQGYSNLPCPEWDDARGHGTNSFFRYRVNGLANERIVMSRHPPPYFVRAHPHATWWVLNLIRVLMVLYTALFLVGILRIRYHYSTDISIAIFFACFVACNEKLLQPMIRFMYRPVDSRYADAPKYPLSMHPQSYQDALSKVGVGGLI